MLVWRGALLYHHVSMAASFDNPTSDSFGEASGTSNELVQSLPCVVLLSPGGATRMRLEAVLRRPGLVPIFCDDALSAMGEVSRLSAGKGPASCVLLLDQPALLAGIEEMIEAAPKFVEVPIVWVFEPGPPVSLKDTPWDEVRSMLRAGKAEPGLGRPDGEAVVAKPELQPALQTAWHMPSKATGKPSADEWVASSSETWAMPGMSGGAGPANRTLKLTGEPLPARDPEQRERIEPAAGPARSVSQTGGFETPEELADATPQPKSSWLASSGQILSDDELAMLLGPDGTPTGEGSEDGRDGGFMPPRGS